MPSIEEEIVEKGELEATKVINHFRFVDSNIHPLS
jgi:hypothetical protein